MKALVIDDAPDIRIYVRALLEKWGYETKDASDGLEGLNCIRESDIRIVVCDWEMPGMSGPELCRAVREAKLEHYVYIILLTGRSETPDLVEGLNAGSDDFLAKPVNAQVLQARLRVGERILKLEQQHTEQNHELRNSRDRLRKAYKLIQSDLMAAARIQRQMLPRSDNPLHPLRAAWLFLPASQVSGDSFNFFELPPDRIGFYHLDVSGHGIPAALLSASLCRALIPGGEPGIAQRQDFLEPALLLANLNRELSNPEGEIENFATIAYGIFDRRTGEGEIAMAGHPPPIIIRNGGEIQSLNLGGLPIGMFPEVAYESQKLHLDAGDKLILYSDGITECQSEAGEMFDVKRLEAVATTTTSQDLPDALRVELTQWRGSSEFEDDISMLILNRPLAKHSETTLDKNPGETP